MVTQFTAVNALRPLSLPNPSAVTAREESSRDVAEEPTAVDKPDRRIQAEIDRFQRAQEKLRYDYSQKLTDLAAEKAVPGGLEEVMRRRKQMGDAFDTLEKATKEKWPLAIDAKMKNIDKALEKVTDLLDAIGGKPITDKLVIEAFKTAIASATGIPVEQLNTPPDHLTRDAARNIAVMSKVHLFNLAEWNGFEFKALAVSGQLGSSGEDLTFSEVIPKDVQDRLKKDPNLKEKRDNAIKGATEEFGNTRYALNALNERFEKYKQVKGVFDAYVVFAAAQQEVQRAHVQVQAALEANAADWVEGSSYPKFRAAQREFLEMRGRAFEEMKDRCARIREQIKKEEADNRIK